MTEAGAARELNLPNIHSQIENKQDVRDRVLTDENENLKAAVINAEHGNVWYVERVEGRDGHAYRALLLKPNFVTKPSMNPQDHARGEFMSETLQTCQAFVFDIPTDAVETITSTGGLQRQLAEQYRYGIQQTLVEKRRVHSNQQVLSLYQEKFTAA
ncbi:hypothetical protein [Salinibaculum rarum]|uniref:hypothetical protein n=1 Tax=Salinibaculum rarum TaxID=3058903 RepID=UPI00265DB251|nr:hypothetical protein [Salinibaculum sp. KK48]